jgi:hypothetical protein
MKKTRSKKSLDTVPLRDVSLHKKDPECWSRCSEYLSSLLEAMLLISLTAYSCPVTIHALAPIRTVKCLVPCSLSGGWIFKEIELSRLS